MRIIVYSHDAFGLGNIRRMLAICQHLLTTIPKLSILVLSGSPAIHSFQIPERLDYIKLPCFGRDCNGQWGAKYIASDISETIHLRSNLIKTTIINFKPDLILVDKKPYGLLNELKPSLDYLKIFFPKTKLVLLLRDILDEPNKTIESWQKQGYYQAIQNEYDRVLVVGMPEIFDLVQEYQFPYGIAQKTKFCGYIRKPFQPEPTATVRQVLSIQEHEQFVLVTPGGGGDGHDLVNTYLSALERINFQQNLKSLIVLGSEMPTSERKILIQKTKKYSNVFTFDFTENLMRYIHAADLVVSMAGYNTITEILALGQKTVVVPRQHPSKEQLIRAERMAKKGLIKMLYSDSLTVEELSQQLQSELAETIQKPYYSFQLDFEGLPKLEQEIYQLLLEKKHPLNYLTA